MIESVPFFRFFFSVRYALCIAMTCDEFPANGMTRRFRYILPSHFPISRPTFSNISENTLNTDATLFSFIFDVSFNVTANCYLVSYFRFFFFFQFRPHSLHFSETQECFVRCSLNHKTGFLVSLCGHI